METSPRLWKVLDKQRLLSLLMEKLAGNAHISFEGDLHHLRLLEVPGASTDTTAALKRNTLWPEQDFVVLPVEPGTNQQIINAIGGSVPKAIIHVQIEKDGLIQFGAYDNFHPECIYFGDAITEATIEMLVGSGVMRLYTRRRPSRPWRGRGPSGTVFAR